MSFLNPFSTFVSRKLYYLWGNCQAWRFPGESSVLKFNPSETELFQAIPKSVSEPFRIIPNQSEKCFVSRLMKNGQKSIRINPIHSASMRMNSNQVLHPNHSQLLFIQIYLDWKTTREELAGLALPWRKFRIGNQPEEIRSIPNHVEIFFRTILNYSEKCFVSPLIKKRSKINPN